MLEKKEASFQEVYGDKVQNKERVQGVKDTFAKHFGEDKTEVFTAPGRTEIVGNHTDHNGGKVIAASIDMDTIAAARVNGTSVINIISEGYDEKIVVDLSDLAAIPKNNGTRALVAGMMEAITKFGYKCGGFDAYVTTNVIRAAGVSSSASFEMVVCAIANQFFNDNAMSYETYAKIGQYAENVYWEKASGLMDQMACAVGGAIKLSFAEEGKASYEKLSFSFAEEGYQLVIVNTGKGHADLSREYSDIPNEMKSVAKVLGTERLCETDEESMLKVLDKIDNDRAVLRALHFFEENKRVEAMETAVEAHDIEKILSILDASGKSSWEWLQNCYTNTNYTEQKITLTLALTQLYLNKINAGICRVHGGGFAGVIACVLPQEECAEYVKYIGQYVGAENVYPMDIRQVGAVHITE